MKELFGILLSDDNNNEGYDLYINSKNEDISETAQILKNIEKEQETKRLSFFNVKLKKEPKKKFKSVTTSEKNESSQNTISSDVHLYKNTEPEK